MQIKDLSEKYHFCSIEGEFQALAENVGAKTEFSYGFALLSDCEIIELWGFYGFIPFVNKSVYEVYRAK